VNFKDAVIVALEEQVDCYRMLVKLADLQLAEAEVQRAEAVLRELVEFYEPVADERSQSLSGAIESGLPLRIRGQERHCKQGRAMRSSCAQFKAIANAWAKAVLPIEDGPVIR